MYLLQVSHVHVRAQELELYFAALLGILAEKGTGNGAPGAQLSLSGMLAPQVECYPLYQSTTPQSDVLI